MDDDVPLERWAQMREHRKRPVGARRAILLVPGESGGSHVNPSAPRLLMEWDGYQWVTVGVGDDYAAGRRFVQHIEGDGVIRLTKQGPAFGPQPGRGRHRKPQPPS
ncbi:DUF6087 family protein [Streptacidiphilus sp. MAP5-52]|uniref:DUF6087 family protein n=1 Tax=Streptacidiphilus sp. MAP5-52 TaxID=3156267 RepID=UPI00351168D2